MRVTNKMMSDGFLTDLNLNMNNLKKLNQQLTSGKEIKRPSDDPFKAARSMQLHTDINTNKQYNENIKDIKNWLEETDTALNQVGNQVQRVRELLISAGNGSYGKDDRIKIKDEINQVVGQITQSLNASFDGKYLFSGTRVTKKPFTVLTTDVNRGNVKLQFAGEEGETLPDPIKTKVKDISSWRGQDISFEYIYKDPTGNDITELINIKLDNNINDLDELEKEINRKIEGNNKLKGKLKAIGTKGDINFALVDGGANIKIDKATTVVEMDSLKDKKVDNYGINQVEMLSDNLVTEISQGVKMFYNISAMDIVKFTDNDGNDRDLRNVLEDIIKHLDNDDDVKKIVNDDLEAIDAVMGNVLKLRSQVGSKANRMESALEKNKSENFSMTEILSKTEDIDFAEKTMEQAISLTVYQAALQTSARVLVPTLMDYLR